MALFSLRRMGTVLLCALALLAGGPESAVKAADFVRPLESARGLAMGGALTAAADSFDAMFYNPAALAMTDYWKVEVRSWNEVGYDSDSHPSTGYFDRLETLGEYTAEETNAFLESFGAEEQTQRSMKFGGFHTSKGFGLAMFETERLNSIPSSTYSDDGSGVTPDPTIDLTYDRLEGVIATLAYSSKLKLMGWGVNLKYFNREAATTTIGEIDFSDPNFQTKSGISGEAEYGYDIGFIARLPIGFLRPTLGVAVLNMIPMDFSIPSVAGMEREVNVGMAFEPGFFDGTRLIITVDSRDTSNTAFPEDESKRRREHFGTEISFYPQKNGVYGAQLRMGLSQGFTSVGFGINLGHFASIDFVSYKEDIGEGLVRIPRQRQMLEFSLGF